MISNLTEVTFVQPRLQVTRSLHFRYTRSDVQEPALLKEGMALSLLWILPAAAAAAAEATATESSTTEAITATKGTGSS